MRAVLFVFFCHWLSSFFYFFSFHWLPLYGEIKICVIWQAEALCCQIVCPSVRPFVRPSTPKLVNAMFWIRLKRYRCQLSQVVHVTTAWKRSTLVVRSQKSRPHEAVNKKCGGMVDASFTTTLESSNFLLLIYPRGYFKESGIFAHSKVSVRAKATSWLTFCALAFCRLPKSVFRSKSLSAQ